MPNYWLRISQYQPVHQQWYRVSPYRNAIILPTCINNAIIYEFQKPWMYKHIKTLLINRKLKKNIPIFFLENTWSQKVCFLYSWTTKIVFQHRIAEEHKAVGSIAFNFRIWRFTSIFYFKIAFKVVLSSIPTCNAHCSESKKTICCARPVNSRLNLDSHL